MTEVVGEDGVRQQNPQPSVWLTAAEFPRWASEVALHRAVSPLLPKPNLGRQCRIPSEREKMAALRSSLPTVFLHQCSGTPAGGSTRGLTGAPAGIQAARAACGPGMPSLVKCAGAPCRVYATQPGSASDSPARC